MKKMIVTLGTVSGATHGVGHGAMVDFLAWPGVKLRFCKIRYN